MQEKIFRAIEEGRQRYIDELGEMVRIYPLGEERLQEAIDMSMRTHVVGKVIGSGGGRSLILITHPDADPIDTGGWTQEPHTGQITNGRMYG